MPKKVSISNGVLWVLFAVLACFMIFGFVEYGLPSLRGELRVALYADTLTYEDVATGRRYVPQLISATSNLYGPVLIFDLLGHSRVAVLFFNFFMAGVGIYFLTRNENLLRMRLLFLLMTSTLFMFSFFGLNKEIILFVISILVYRFIRTDVLWYLLFAMALSILVRWQMSVFCLMVFMFWRIPIMRQWRVLSVTGLLLALSVAISLGSNGVLAHVNEVADLGALDESGGGASGLFPLMLSIQNAYGYFIIFVPKTAMLLFGLIARFDLSLVYEGFWNYFVIMFQSIQNLVLFTYLFFKKRIKLKDDIFFLMVIYCALFSITPIFGPRYLFPVTLWAIISCCKVYPPRRTS